MIVKHGTCYKNTCTLDWSLHQSGFKFGILFENSNQPWTRPLSHMVLWQAGPFTRKYLKNTSYTKSDPITVFMNLSVETECPLFYANVQSTELEVSRDAETPTDYPKFQAP